VHRLIIIAWPDRRRVATKSKASAEMASAEMTSAEIQRLRFFCEHRSPPFAVQPEASGERPARSSHPSSRGQLRSD